MGIVVVVCGKICGDICGEIETLLDLKKKIGVVVNIDSAIMVLVCGSSLW